MRKSTVLLLAVVGICVFAAGCKKKSAYEPSQLMGKLMSGASVREAQRELGVKPSEWETVDDRRSLSDATPPWHEFVILKKDYSAYGQTGDLVLSFFNEELVSVQFYPGDVGAAKEALAAKGKISFSSAGDARTSIATRVWIGKDQQGRDYIGWIDKARQALREQTVQ
jgi:hypothetical protein